MNKQNFTREELYDLVWSEPMLSLSKIYNISDVGLRKICIRMSIPLPAAGHWQKLKFGKKVFKLPLTQNYKGEQEVSLSQRDESTPFPIRGESPLSVLIHQIQSDKSLKLTVPEKLTNPDKLIIAAKNNLLGQKPDSHTYLGRVCCSRDNLDIRVSKDHVLRALRFMDTLIKALRVRGHDVIIRNGDTYAIVEEHDFKILLREKNKRQIVKDGNWNSTVFHPLGILYFQFYGYPQREWKDGKLSLEEQLSKIIAQLELSGQEWKELRQKQKKEKEEREERERLQKEFEKRQEEDLIKFKEMLSSATRWHKASNLRNYINAVEENAIKSSGISIVLKNWLEWAKKKADWYDPFVETNDELLTDIDKNTLAIPKRKNYNGW